MFRRSKDKEKFEEWATIIHSCISEGKALIETLQDLNEKNIDQIDLLNDFITLNTDFQALETMTKAHLHEEFKLKGTEKEEEKNLREEISLFLDDLTFFQDEIRKKVEYGSKLRNAIAQIENTHAIISENETRQQKLARSIPSLRNSGEIALAEQELNDLKQKVSEPLQQDKEFPDELNTRIERLNSAINEWNRKLTFIETNLAKYRTKVDHSKKEAEYQEKLSSIHSWLDKSETKLKKLRQSIKSINNTLSDDATPSKDLLNLEKSITKAIDELSSIEAPKFDEIGPDQSVIGVRQRKKEIEQLKKELHSCIDEIYRIINYRLAYIRARILERMFLKSHQLSFNKINYSLGLRNELLFKGWLDEKNKENDSVILKNHLNKYVMLSKPADFSYKEVAESIFKLIEDFSNFEREKNEISYKVSLKWLIQNDAKLEY